MQNDNYNPTPIDETDFARNWGQVIAQHGYYRLPHVVRRKAKRLVTAAQYVVLEELLFWFAKGKFNPYVQVPRAEIAADVGVDEGQVTRVINQLVKDGWVKKVPGGGPKTVNIYDLGPALDRLELLSRELAAEDEERAKRKALREANLKVVPKLARQVQHLATVFAADRLPAGGKVPVDASTLYFELSNYFGPNADLAQLDEVTLTAFAQQKATDYLCKVDLAAAAPEAPAPQPETKKTDLDHAIGARQLTMRELAVQHARAARANLGV